jgi:hypothetical protein
MAKFKVEIYNSENIKDILQIAYDLSDEQIVQAQNEINKMANATQLQSETMESKARYGKIINDYLTIKDKAISKKVEIAKLLSDILNSYKNSQSTVADVSASKQTFDLAKIKEMVKNMHEENNNNEKTKTIELTKK